MAPRQSRLGMLRKSVQTEGDVWSVVACNSRGKLLEGARKEESAEGCGWMAGSRLEGADGDSSQRGFRV